MASLWELEREPPMKAQRPSSARTQRAEHVLTNVFKDILSNDGIDPTKIKRLIVTQTEEPGYHRRYVSQLKNIEDEREKKLKELAHVENHLMQAYALATVADEKRLTHATRDCENFSSLGLPSSEFSLASHLNEDLLRRHHLVTLSSILKQPQPKEEKPTVPAVPRYAQPTNTSKNHEKIRGTTATRIESSGAKIKPVAWKDTLGSNDRQEGRALLAQLERKATYKRNPRFAASSVESGLVDPTTFVAEPAVVSFDDYSPGQYYQQVVKVRNVSQISQQLRVIPPATPHFSISSSEFPGEKGIVAPGLFFSFTITFAPNSLADFDDHVKIQMPNGNSLIVGLEGKRLAPSLSLPTNLDCGYCLVGGRKIVEIECCNTGGKGKFRVLPGTASPSDEFMDFGYVMLPPFEFQPACFELKRKESVVIKIIFTSMSLGKHFQSIKIVTDGNHVREHLINGVCEEAIVSFANPEDSDIVFPHQNPTGVDQRVISVTNHCHVDLPFYWLLTVPPCVQPDVSHIPGAKERPFHNVFSAMKDTSLVFSLSPQRGTLSGLETMQAIVSFQPNDVGVFCSVASLVLENVPEVVSDDKAVTNQTIDVASLFQRQALEIHLKGVCHDFNVEAVPPVIHIPRRLLRSEEHRFQFKLINGSYSSVSFDWNPVDHPHALSVEPATGTISCGGERVLELVLCPGPSGFQIATALTCIISSKHRVVLPVHAEVKGSDVRIDLASLSFGLVRMGESATVDVPLRNTSSAPAHFHLEQYREQISEVSFCPQDGDIPPYGEIVSKATYKPNLRREFSSVARLSIQGGENQFLTMRGLAQAPSACLDFSSVYFDELFLGVPSSSELTLHNRTLLSTTFHWMPVQGEDSSFCDVRISPSFGELSPGEAKTIVLSVIPSQVRPIDDLFVSCSVEGMPEGPLYVSIAANVSDLTVSYATPMPAQIDEASIVFDNSLGLEFACECCQPDSQQRIVVIRNNSAIASSFTVEPEILRAALPKQQTSPAGQHRPLLSRTPNLTDPISKIPDKSQEDVSRQYLSSGHGAVVLIEPSSGQLAPFAECQVVVSAYADMWGHYTDHITFAVVGVPDPFRIPLSVDAIGSPLSFLIGGRSIQDDDYPTLRFGAHVPQDDPIKRSVRIKNRGPTDIRLDWSMFSTSDSAFDDQLIDMNFWLGDPFPLVLPSGKAVESVASLDNDLLRVDVKNHEGNKDADLPFTVEPKQMTVAARSQAIVQVSFSTRLESDSKAFSTCFDAFSLAHCNIDKEDPAWVKRRRGVDVVPLKLGITGEIRQAWLDVEADDDEGLVFEALASDLLKEDQLAKQVMKVHSIKLRNSNPNSLTFTLASDAPFRIVNRDQLGGSEPITVRSQASIKVRLGFLFTSETLENVKEIRNGVVLPGYQFESDWLQIGKRLCISYSNKTVQDLDLQARVAIPHLELSQRRVDFGVVLVGETQPSTISLWNASLSDSQWTLAPVESNAAFQCSPSQGTLEGHRTNVSANKAALTFHFTPSAEGYTTAKYVVSGMLTEQPLLIELEGRGSYDETYSRPITKTK
ncbi:deleted in lung and esophageal cancer protein 1-like [Oscarella lobularis]|uniref:deleted in lung and esophageal cancer protein 1-like n=1 Tax=Oscarella lobularis TaxID=121494 RepID=UPI0033131A98